MTPSGFSLRQAQSDLDALRALLLKMIGQGQTDDALDLIVGLLSDLRDQNDTLQLRLKTAQRKLYGRSSEKLSPDQLELFTRLLGQDFAIDPSSISTFVAPENSSATGSEAPTPSSASNTSSNTSSHKGKHGRSGMPEGLERTITHVAVPDNQRQCSGCGQPMKSFGSDSTWQVEFHPGHFLVQVTECEKVSCPRCRDQVVTAKAPGKVIPGSPPGPGLLARMMVDKGEDNLPLERQQRRMAREGFHVAMTTLEGWWAQSAELLAPLHRALLDDAIGAWLPQIDATGLDVIDRKHPKGLRLGHVWTVAGARAVAFVYASVKRDGLGDLLVQRCGPGNTQGGPIQCDGEPLFQGAMTRKKLDLVAVHCNMHARRYFEKALKSGDLRAAVAMKMYAQIYQIEQKATEDKVSVEQRTRRRWEQTWPLLEQFRQWDLEIRPKVNPSSPLAKALNYVEKRWLSLVLFVIDGRIPLDTGEVERQNRRIAVGRKVWLFSGSDDGARRLCIVASLCATCRKLGIDPWEYLRDVFMAIASGISAIKLVADFTPWAWADKKKTQKPNTQQVVVTA
jgi:transposase